MTPVLNRRIVFAAYCRGCRARIGHRCISRQSGKQLAIPHPSRQRLAADRFADIAEALRSEKERIAAERQAQGRPPIHSSGRWQLGQSGNPYGRLRKLTHRNTRAHIRQLLSEEWSQTRLARRFRVSRKTIRRVQNEIKAQQPLPAKG